jgi:dTDP-4-amino-4,6-dideoxygalactose transaminase
LLAEVDGVRAPSTLPGNEPVWHLYVVRVAERDAVLARLNAEGIGAGVHYPVPIHLQGAFGHLGHRRGDFPVTERAADEILSLPMHPHLTESDQERVVEQLAKAVRNV